MGADGEAQPEAISWAWQVDSAVAVDIAEVISGHVGDRFRTQNPDAIQAALFQHHLAEAGIVHHR